VARRVSSRWVIGVTLTLTLNPSGLGVTLTLTLNPSGSAGFGTVTQTVPLPAATAPLPRSAWPCPSREDCTKQPPDQTQPRYSLTPAPPPLKASENPARVKVLVEGLRGRLPNTQRGPPSLSGSGAGVMSFRGGDRISGQWLRGERVAAKGAKGGAGAASPPLSPAGATRLPGSTRDPVSDHSPRRLPDASPRSSGVIVHPGFPYNNIATLALIHTE